MTLDEAYQNLGLTPLDEYIAQRVKENLMAHAGPDLLASSIRQIGASTWMCVRAAMTLATGTEVLLSASVRNETERLARLIMKYTADLFQIPWTEQNGEFVQFDRAKMYLAHGTGVVGRVGFRGVCYRDDEWKGRTVRRAKGPFAMIRTIRRTHDNHFLGYAEEDEFIMELSEEGARDMLNENSEVQLVGVDGTVSPRKPETARVGPSLIGLDGNIRQKVYE